MHYLEVLISSSSYHGSETLTYSYDTPLDPGSIVLVPMRAKRVTAVVIGSVPRPKFTTKPIIGLQVERPSPDQILKLMKWMGSYYPAPSGTIISQFLPNNLLLSGALGKPKENPAGNPNPLPLPQLTKDQLAALQQIEQSNERTALLHGDTGTGKTRVYIEMAKKCLDDGRSVVILTPEIGLTSQLAGSLQRHLSAPVLVAHSGLTGQQRRTLWLQALFADQPLVIVGPRSALFTPLQNIGLVIVDEAHDNAYKQDQSPRYHALRVAAKLVDLHSAKLVFGTATPLITEYYYALAKKIPIVRLTELATKTTTPPKITLVNARDRSLYTRSPHLSNPMIEAVALSLEKGEQSLVFLNRRGTARLVMCQNCDWHALCPNCNVPLTYHGDTHSMRCHTCGYKSPAVTVCPVCASSDVIFKSIGTKAIASALQSLFPSASVQRFDTDNIKEERFEKQYEAVREGQVDILVGTQMLVKGLDLPKLGMVGVVAADSSLYFPDFTAEEQTYQLLTQVIGRVGRGHTEDSTVVIQTYDPEGRALTTAVSKDWTEFYDSQIAERQAHKFPPFYYVLKVYCSRKSQSSAIKTSESLRSTLRNSGLPIEVSDPSPRFIEQSGGDYNWQLIIRAKNRSALISAIDLLPANWHYDIDPLNLL